MLSAIFVCVSAAVYTDQRYGVAADGDQEGGSWYVGKVTVHVSSNAYIPRAYTLQIVLSVTLVRPKGGTYTYLHCTPLPYNAKYLYQRTQVL